MAKWIVGSGLDEYIASLERMGKLTDGMCGKAMYQGAKIVADQVKKNIESLPVQEDAHNGGMVKGVTKDQKEGLLEGFGIAPKQNDNGFVHVKLGFDGYNAKKTDKYPNGQPNSMIARIVESGNSYHVKTPFIAPAIRATKASAEEKMKMTFEKELADFGRENNIYQGGI